MVVPVRILTPSLEELLGEIDNYESLRFERRFHAPSSFELRINRYKKNVDKLQKGNIIFLGSDTGKAGIIKHKEITLDEAGKLSESWIIRGWTLQGFARQRIVLPPEGQSHDEIEAEAETVLKHFMDSQLVSPADAKRKIDNLRIADDQQRGETVRYESRFDRLDELLAEIGRDTGLGWNIYLDIENGEYVFEVYEGVDRRADQEVNPRVIFSPEFESLAALEFSDSDLDYKNVAVVAGQGEMEERTIEIVEQNDPEGMNRFEFFRDARQTEDNRLVTVGQRELEARSIEQYMEGQVLEQSPFIYEEHFDLGDVVTIQNKDWGITMDTRIVGATEVYDDDGFRLMLTFGEDKPTLLSKIKDEIKEPLTETVINVDGGSP